MPKLYEYFGLIVLFYSNEHEPIHVHGKYQGTESKAEIIMDDGEIAEIRYSLLRGKKSLNDKKFRDFKILVRHFPEEIVQTWIDYFVLHKPMTTKKITKNKTV